MVREKMMFLAIISFMLLNSTACSNNTKNTDEAMTMTVTPTSKASLQSNLGDIINNQDKSITLSKIDDGFWVYTTSKMINGSSVPANGLIVVSSDGLILLDTPWNDEKTKELVKFAESTFGKSIVLAVITHAHDDRVGGIHALLEENIKALSTELTADLAEDGGYDRPLAEIKNDVEIIDVGDVNMEIFYPGEGHTSDNIIVWFSDKKLLYGGCFIKSTDSKSIGNTGDANLKQWPVSLERLIERYPDVEIVIPGHNTWGGKELLDHTLELAKMASKE